MPLGGVEAVDRAREHPKLVMSDRARDRLRTSSDGWIGFVNCGEPIGHKAGRRRGWNPLERRAGLV
jgi:hypothetical protein